MICVFIAATPQVDYLTMFSPLTRLPFARGAVYDAMVPRHWTTHLSQPVPGANRCLFRHYLS
ncbi:hypothetical protein MCP1_140056 [Candidatus Terasakiella magnetica]|nr:hypothetical protein MCP1_140056 [Candidatus Terasakiella magnetica]